MMLLSQRLTLGVPVLAAAGLLACSAAAQAEAPDLPRAFTNDGSATLAVRPLDDPANPYRGRYSPVECWLYGHCEDAETRRARELAWFEQHPPDGSRVWTELDGPTFFLSVTEDGWLVPQAARRDSQRQSRAAQTVEEALNREPQPTGAQPRWFYISCAAADLPPALASSRVEDYERMTIRDRPRIPLWLGTRPPLRVQFLPSGEILAYGELDLHYTPLVAEDAANSPTMPGAFELQGETWYRYSAEGKLLGKLPHSPDFRLEWVPLYWPQAAQMLAAAAPAQERVQSGLWNRGWVMLIEQVYVSNPVQPVPRKTVYGVWDYTGKPLDLAGPAPDYTQLMHGDMNQQELARTFALQQKYGITDLASASPYEGQPDGPQAVAPAPRPWPRIVRSGDSSLFVRALDPDSPANRYRGAYGAWDRWAWAQYGQPRPGRKRFFTREEMARTGGSEAVNFYDTWRELWLPVESDGALVPFAQAGLRASDAFLGFDRRDPHGPPWENAGLQFFSGGELDERQWGSLLAEKYGATLARYPQFPQWLLSQPAPAVIFVPNGEVLAQFAPLGSFDDSPAAPEQERNRAGRSQSYYVYDAQGVLQAVLPGAGEHGWMDRYRSPAVQARLAAYRAAGCTVRDADGFTVVYAGPVSVADPVTRRSAWVDPPPAVLAAFDWDGTELEAGQPLTRPDYRCCTLEWRVVRDVAAARAVQAGG